MSTLKNVFPSVLPLKALFTCSVRAQSVHWGVCCVHGLLRHLRIVDQM